MKIFYYILVVFILGCSSNAMSYVDNNIQNDDVEYLIEQSCQCDVKVVYNLSNSYKNNISYSFKNNTLNVNAPNKIDAEIAAYSYLDGLGFKFYGPEDHWTHIPTLNRSQLSISNKVDIKFKHNVLFSSGGLGLRKFTSLDRSKKLWKRWMKRLRYAERERLRPTHYGARFNKKYKDLILANSSWLPKNKKFKTVNGKLCFDNPEVVELYKRDAETRLRELISKGEEGPYYINMEPSDGGGHCYSDLQKISDTVFGLANEVAKHIKTIDDNAWVTLYAYNDHALVPTFTLEDNIVVGLVTDAFQREKSPEQLLTEWEIHHPHVYFSGYMNLPIWELELSDTWDAQNLINTIERYKEKDYYGYRYEVSPSFFVNGWNIYSVSKATYGDFQSEKGYQEFMDLMLPNDRLKYLFNLLVKKDTEIYFNDLIEQLLIEQKKTNDIDLKFRIEDMVIYAQYKLAYKAYNSDKSAFNEKQLLAVLEKDRPYLNLHSYALHNMFTRKSKVAFDNVQKQNFKVVNTQGQLKVEDSKNVFGSEKQPKSESVIRESKGVDIRHYFKGIVYHPGNSSIKFSIQADMFFKNAAGEIELINNITGEKYYEKIIYDNEFHEYDFFLENAGTYSVNLVRLKGKATIKLPTNAFAFTDRHATIDSKKPMDFYFHTCSETIVIDIPARMRMFKVINNATGEVLCDIRKNPKGKTVKLKLKNSGVYNIKTYQNNFKILSEPHYISLHPDEVWYSDCKQNNRF